MTQFQIYPAKLARIHEWLGTPLSMPPSDGLEMEIVRKLNNEGCAVCYEPYDEDRPECRVRIILPDEFPEEYRGPFGPTIYDAAYGYLTERHRKR